MLPSVAEDRSAAVRHDDPNTPSEGASLKTSAVPPPDVMTDIKHFDVLIRILNDGWPIEGW